MKKNQFASALLLLLAASLFAKEQDDSYLAWDTFKYVGTEFFGIPAMVEYCCEKNENAKSEKAKWKGQAVARKIYFRSYTLGAGEAGTDEYIVPQETATVVLPYYTADEKRTARDAMKREAEKKKEQAERLSEDRRLNPGRLSYSMSDTVDFSALKPILTSESPRFSEGKIYGGESLNLFLPGYTIKADGSRFSFMANNGAYMRNRYEFLLLNSDAISGSGNFVRYLGIAELVDGFGNVKYFEKWELLKENPLIKQAIENNPLDYDDIEIPESIE